MNKVEAWKAEKHPFEVWEAIERHASAGTAMSAIDERDLERMKWYGLFYRKRDEDGRYMIRVRLPGCEMTSAQARVIAEVARAGHSIIDVTTRGNVQVQGLAIGDLPDVIGGLEDVGLTSRQTGHDNVRNVMAHPWAGIDPSELVDVRPLCRRLTDVFLGSRELSDLPRKINVAVDGRPVPAPHCWTQDVSFVAARRLDGSVAFHWLLAGTQGQNPRLAWKLPVWVREDEAPAVLLWTLRVFRAEGSREKRDRARLRYLIEEIGPEGFLARVEEGLGHALERSDEPVPGIAHHEDFLGWMRQKQEGLWALGVSTPLGRLTHTQLDGLADVAEVCGDGTLRTAYDQGIVIPNIGASQRRAAVRGLNRVGLEHEADTVTRSMIACTGRQFCNIAVSETKGHAFGLMERLRAKGVKLAGIKIHMSGCPSSCAQTYIGDIGLKGVRVRRAVGTRDGFDVYLGGGVQGTVELGRLYRKGVDVDQLPELIEYLVKTYDRESAPGQSFSAFWRNLMPEQASLPAVAEAEFRPDIWLCESCGHRHAGEDPPVFCPRCAALRRAFARLGDEPEPAIEVESRPARLDGYVDVAAWAVLEEKGRLGVEVDGKELALFVVDGQVRCLDALCPHEGGPMLQGDLRDGIVTCPWHAWTFRVSDGCATDGNGCRLGSYPVKVEDGRVLVRTADAAAAPATTRADEPEVVLRVIAVVQETHDTKTVRLDNAERRVKTHQAGQHIKVGVETGTGTAWRSFTLSSPPTRPEVIEVTVKRNPDGVVSNAIHTLQAGDMLTVRGPSGRFVFDPEEHREPLVLAVAGSGVTPAMSILRTLRDRSLALPVTLLYGCRTRDDIIFGREIDALAAEMPSLRAVVTLTRPGPGWTGASGRITPEFVARHVAEPAGARYFLCGPPGFREPIIAWLEREGVAVSRIHFEVFGKAARSVAAAVP